MANFRGFCSMWLLGKPALVSNHVSSMFHWWCCGHDMAPALSHHALKRRVIWRIEQARSPILVAWTTFLLHETLNRGEATVRLTFTSTACLHPTELCLPPGAHCQAPHCAQLHIRQSPACPRRMRIPPQRANGQKQLYVGITVAWERRKITLNLVGYW